jgi:hypothetical protein
MVRSLTLDASLSAGAKVKAVRDDRFLFPPY